MGPRCLVRGLHGGLHFGLGLLVHLVTRGIGAAQSQQRAAGVLDGVVFQGLFDFTGVAVSGQVHRNMAFDAVSAGMQQSRPLARANGLHQLGGFFVNCPHIVAVDLVRCDAQAFAARRGAGAGDHGAAGGGGAPAVVFTHKQHRQLVHLRPVEGFQKRPPVGGAVAKEANGDVAALLQFLGVRGAHGNGQTRCHHAVGPQHADRKIGNVHGAAFASVEPSGFAVQLAHHAAQVRPLGQSVAMATVRGGQVIARGEVGAHARSHAFLPGGQVQGAAHFGAAVGGFVVGADTALAQDFCGIFKGPDAGHAQVQSGQCVFLSDGGQSMSPVWKSPRKTTFSRPRPL